LRDAAGSFVFLGGGQCDGARRAEKLAPIVATKEEANLGPNDVPGREAHRDFFVTFPRGS